MGLGIQLAHYVVVLNVFSVGAKARPMILLEPLMHRSEPHELNSKKCGGLQVAQFGLCLLNSLCVSVCVI